MSQKSNSVMPWCVQASNFPKETPEAPEFEEEFSIPERLIQSSVASLSSIFVTYPLYALKFDMQAGQPLKFGLRHLYHGVKPIIQRSGPTTSAFILSNDLLGGGEDAPMSQQVFAGVGSGIVTAAISSPFELVLTKQRLHQSSEKEVTRDIRRRHGFSGYTQGIRATIARDVIYSLGLFVAPNILRAGLPEDYQDSMAATIGSAALSGAIAGVISLPVDAVRGEIQRAEWIPGQKTLSMKEAYQRIIERGGTAELMKGYRFRGAQIALSFAVMNLAFETVQDIQLSSRKTPATTEQKEAAGYPFQKHPLRKSPYSLPTAQDERLEQQRLLRQRFVMKENFSPREAQIRLFSLQQNYLKQKSQIVKAPENHDALKAKMERLRKRIDAER